jgi:endonuclease YncB( thermonuclease family)
VRRPPLPLAALTATVALAASAALTAAPARAQALQYWTGTVTRVSDGDTIWVDVAGDRTADPRPVRMIGVQATETFGSPAGGGPECGSVAAKQALRRLLPVGSRVRLSAYRASSTKGTAGGKPRLFRYVDRRVPRTRAWQDVQLLLLDRGHVLWLRSPVETAHVAAYHRAMQRAAAKKVGLFSGAACGVGPSTGARLWMWLNYDADDESAPDGEYVRVYNPGTTAVPLTGWRLRDGSHAFFGGTTYWTFPAGTVVGPRQAVTLHLGPGDADPATGRFHLTATGGRHLPNRADPGDNRAGQTVYLLDPHLDLRAMGDYPCTAACRRPPVEIADVRPTGAVEEVDLRLTASATTTQDLSGVVLTNDGRTRELDPGTLLSPGETLTVRLTAGTSSRLVQYWPHDVPLLGDAGDTVVLRTAGATVLDTWSWGTG